ncbi:hypothetical protein SEA_ZEPP_31 [Microbacterium phage Zepp]|nr:hypothetical protein SEA_ZEPP_31 [Microbacterium phage Zepp]
MFTRTIRGTGEKLTVGTAAELKLDATDGKWVTVCEDHGSIVNSAIQSAAYYTHGADFCEGCRAAQATPKAAAKNPAAGKVIKLAFANGQDIKVHAADCADLKKAATKRAAHNGIHTQTFPAGTDERDVWIDFNDDFLNEGGADAAWPLEFLPCCHGAGLAKNADRTWAGE